MHTSTTWIQSQRLNRHLDFDVTLASEAFQVTGSFKFRAAYHLASNVPQQRIITASSGNFGQALAWACHLLGKESHVVMPGNSAQVKVEAVREYGGVVHLIDTARISRAERVAELAKDFPDAYVASAYDDDLVIAGNASLGRELAAVQPSFDAVLCPVGGGGLASGIIVGLKECGSEAAVYGVEPALANDASRSLAAGHIIANSAEPQTIADGARTVSLGQRNWPHLQSGLKAIFEVSEEDIVQSLRMLFLYANLKAEPTGAVSLAALLSRQVAAVLSGRRICCVVSGGNVDPAIFAGLLVPP